nr:DUF935 family protein [Tepidimonas alkaliphilus]
MHGWHATRPQAAGQPHTSHAPQQPPEPDELDRLVDEAMAGWQPMVEPLADAVQALLDAAAGQGLTAEDVSRRLAQALPGLPVEALAERLARAQFAARLAGVHGREPEGGDGR